MRRLQIGTTFLFDPGLRRLFHRNLRGVEHVFNENPVPRCRIVDENVGDGADELSVLNDGGAAQ